MIAFRSMQKTFDNGYILGGWSDSDSSGDKTQHTRGGTDYWVVKTDSSVLNNGTKGLEEIPLKIFVSLEYMQLMVDIFWGAYTMSDSSGDLSHHLHSIN